jgi:excisionase family DNA binding protein
MERLMTVRQAARLTGVTPRTIQRWVRKGAITAYKTPGGSLRVMPKECMPQPRPATK